MFTTRHRKPIALAALLLATVLGLTACATPAETPAMAPAATAPQSAQTTAQAPANTDTTEGYQVITAEQAKQRMDTETDITIVDVREPAEYTAGHIQNAILLPVGDIAAKAATVLPDKNAKLLLYCRSGRRSRLAAQTLVALGYKNVQDFGGIIDWPYGTVTN